MTKEKLCFWFVALALVYCCCRYVVYSPRSQLPQPGRCAREKGEEVSGRRKKQGNAAPGSVAVALLGAGGGGPTGALKLVDEEEEGATVERAARIGDAEVQRLKDSVEEWRNLSGQRRGPPPPAHTQGALYDLVATDIGGRRFLGDAGVRLAEYLAWRMPSNIEVGEMYAYIAERARDPAAPASVRASAVDALLRSNNPRMMDTGRQALASLRRAQRVSGDAADAARLDSNAQKLEDQARTFAHHPRPASPHYREGSLFLRPLRTGARARAPVPARVERDVDGIGEGDMDVQRVLILQAAAARQLANDVRMNRAREATVYEDRQNVHNSSINATVMRSVRNLVGDGNEVAEAPPGSAIAQSGRQGSGIDEASPAFSPMGPHSMAVSRLFSTSRH